MLISTSLGDCEVCGHEAHGIHFGLLSCRACSAFFRRTVVLSRSYVCRKAEGNCEISKGQRYQCRKCRYEKCLQLGMTAENVQLNRDALSSVEGATSKRRKRHTSDAVCPELSPPSSAATSAALSHPPTPGSSLKCPDPEVIRINKILDMKRSAIITRIKSIMDTFSPLEVSPSIRDQNVLGRMVTGLQRFRERQMYQPTILTHIEFFQLQPMWEEQVYRVAEWFMYSEEFAQLPLKEKMTIYKSSWKTWQRLERTHMSIVIFGEKLMDTKLTILSDEYAANMSELKIHFSKSVSEYSPEYLRGMFAPVANRIFGEVVRPLLDMRLTLAEQAYMLCQLAFHVEGRSITEETRLACEKLRDRVSDCMHHYYLREHNQPNYANRLNKIMTMVHALENINDRKNTVMEMARFFDIIKVNVCDGSMFDTQ